MKRGLVVILIFTAYFSNAQNYQCLQSGAKHYFINGNGYMRGIRIDSVKTLGDTTVYYPFHTPRGSYGDIPYAAPVLNPNGGSWLGKKVLQLNDGTFIFDSYWNDSVIIKTLANIGDSWVFYRDTSSLYYKATVISIDTMTVLSLLDSVKTIMVNAYNGSGILASDPLDSFKIILSKNNGFVQVFDLYTFPYHQPDSVYRTGLDFFLDRSTCSSYDINSASGYAPNANVTIFKVIDFINPNDQQLHNWYAGDIFQSLSADGGVYPYLNNDFILDTVISKTILGHGTQYSVRGLEYYIPSGLPSGSTLSVYGTTGTFSDSVYTIIDTSFIPEDHVDYGNYIFYFPNDTNFCYLNPAYIKVLEDYNPWGLGYVIEHTNYKLGIGETNYHYFDGDPYTDNYDLLYYNVSGVSCGSINYFPSSVNSILIQPIQFRIFPNPATSQLTISSTNQPITQITLTNLIGQTLYTHDYRTEKADIDVTAFPTGVYFIKINGTEVRKFVKE